MTSYRLVIGDGSSTTSGRPDATNTGATGTLTAVYGTQTITTASTLLEDLDIFGQVIVRASGVTIRNCRIRGISGITSGSYGLIDAQRAECVGLTIEDCTVAPDYPSVAWTGILGHDYAATGCNIYNCVDGFGVYDTYSTGTTADVTITGNWVHDMYCWTPAPQWSDNKTHNDGLQVQGNGGVTVRGNNFECFPSPLSAPGVAVTSCFMVSPTVSAAPSMTFEDNWVDGGAAILNLNPTSTTVVRNNRFGRNHTGYEIYVKNGTTVTGLRSTTGLDNDMGNVFDDDDSPVTVTWHA